LDGVREEKELDPIQDLEGHQFFRQLALKVEDWTELAAPRREDDPNPLSGVAFEEYMDDVRDNLRASLSQYEEREAQIQMIEGVNQA
ncbi:hypothetical protein JDS79_42945, partial [Bacillus cereus]|nr:hypothetical protein [Bacillus cereus]